MSQRVDDSLNSATELHRVSASAPTPSVDPSRKPISAYLRCAADNATRVPHGYFSVEQIVAELVVRPMEYLGYVLPQGLSPDTSVGLRLGRLIRDSGSDVSDTVDYPYVGPKGNEARARAYPNRWLPQVRSWITDVWLVEHAPKYFKKADPNALTVVTRIIEERRVKQMAA